MKYLIKNGHIVDPLNKIDEVMDIFVADGKIDKLGRGLDLKADHIIDARDKYVFPGFIDMHVHLREPGREDKETVYTGSRAAIKGGFTSILCMPNTEPAIDRPEVVKLVQDIIRTDAPCRVYISGAITEGRIGAKLTDFGAMKKEGIIALSDDGSSVDDAKLMLLALKGSRENGLLLISHSENKSLSGRGVVNHGYISTITGLRGIPNKAEYEIVDRDINLAKEASSPIHIAHVSTKESVDIIRKAKISGIKVTAETAPHYFTLTDESCLGYDSNTKMNPPLRSKSDLEAVRLGLQDGTIDVIATDHAPHTDSEKYVEFDFAPFGIIGLETAFSVSYMELVEKKVLSLSELVRLLAINPAKILKLDPGYIKEGNIADIVIADLNAKWTVTNDTIISKSKNTPFMGKELKAKILQTFVGGKLVFDDGKFIE